MAERHDDEPLAARLHRETGRIGWAELARHFARGVVLRVAAGTDLLAVATAMAADDRGAVERWMASGELASATTDDARRWERDGGLLWAVVVAPWVLVQESRD